MAGIRTEELLERLTEKRFDLIRLRGLQDGEFCMTLVTDDGIFIHVNQDGSSKRYRRVENILDWLKRRTNLTKIEIDITLWKENEIQSHW